MRTPVIIAAYNEAAYVGRTLESLDPATVEPIVVDNGSTDTTAEVAASYGATVLVRPEKGKLPAQQHVLRTLGERALEPVIFLDADSTPVFPRAWAGALIRPLLHDTPAITAGLVGYRDGWPTDDAIRSGRRILASFQSGRAGSVEALYGANMAMALKTPAMLERVLDMPHIWPGEDRALAQMIKDEGGEFYQSLDPRTFVRTSTRCNVPLVKRLIQRGREAPQNAATHYQKRAGQNALLSYDGGVYMPLSQAENHLSSTLPEQA